ncbi:MAG: hypothetical protein HY554_14070 [Elusimicrobia bacterium]|nr:hypothetical protein [Elusimicrobiota bacterium]
MPSHRLAPWLRVALGALAFAPSPAWAEAPDEALRQLEGWAPGGAAGAAPAVGAVRELAPPPPASLGEPLPPRLLDPEAATREESRAEWLRRVVDLRAGKASLVPLGAFDPERELLVHVPGLGMDFRDVHGLARLADTYQVLIGISDQRRTHRVNARQMADAVHEVLRYRASRRARRGLKARSDLRVSGHSFGAFIAYRTLDELARRGALGQGAEALAGRALYVGIDGPWRGADVPWVFLAPGVKQVAGNVLPLLPLPKRLTPGTLSTINRTRLMVEMRDVTLPPSVTVQFVTVRGPLDTSPGWRHLEPVADWYSAELGKGELKRLWEFLRRGERDPNQLDGWAHLALFRTQGLQNLYRFLQRDADFPAHAGALVEAARRAGTPEEFAPRYDELVARIVATFEGQHTRFMWTDPAFLPWFRGLLRDWDAEGPAR